MAGLEGRRREVALVAAVVAVLLVVLVQHVAITSPSVDQEAARTPADVKLVQVDPEAEAKLWPFTSRQRRFETLTLPINVVVRGDADRVRDVLVSRHVDAGVEGTQERDRRTTGSWMARTVGLRSPADGTGERLPWKGATGATRYSYVHTRSPNTGGWVVEAFQLQDGDYFGTRYHIRAYEGGTGEDRWTALQVHHEHWDWFRLRHTVGSTAQGQQYVEKQFYGRHSVMAIERHRFANGGISDADGWATVVSLSDPSEPRFVTVGASFGLLVGLGASRRRGGRLLARLRRELDDAGRSRRRVLLALALLAFPPAVRAASIAVERAVPALSPKPIAATGYLLLAVGLPVCAGYGSLSLPADESAPLVGASVVAGFLLDYAALQITVLPFSVVVHRFALAAILAVIAAGASRWHGAEHGHDVVLPAGVTLWVLGLLWPVADRLVPAVLVLAR